MARRTLATAVLQVEGLGHQEDLLSHAQRLNRGTEPTLRGAAVVTLRVVYEANPFGERRLEEQVRRSFRSRVTEVPPAQTENRKHHPGAAHPSFRKRAGRER